MRARQRKPGAAVIEQRRRPCRGIVARSAFLRKSGNNMIGVCGPIEAAEMARHTRGLQFSILSIGMTGRALLG